MEICEKCQQRLVTTRTFLAVGVLMGFSLAWPIACFANLKIEVVEKAKKETP